MILGAVHRSPGIYLTAEENPGKPQLGDCLMKAVSHRLKWSLFPPNEIDMIAHQSERESKGILGLELIENQIKLNFIQTLIKIIYRPTQSSPYFQSSILGSN